MRLYAITDRQLLPGAHAPGQLSAEECEGLLRLARAWAAGGVRFVQLREKDLPPDALRQLAGQMAAALQGSDVRLLVNATMPGGVALVRAARGAGIHLGAHLGGRWTAEQVAAARAAGMGFSRLPLRG